MKTPRRSIQLYRILPFLRFGSGLILISAAAAMAFVAVGPSPSVLRNQQAQANPASRPSAVPLPQLRLEHHLETLLGGSGNEAERLNGPEQERYDNIAYPNKFITEAVRTKAAKAAKTLDNTSAPPSQKWKLVGPSGVPASALVASESTGASTGTIFSGRATAIAVAPNCSAASCTVFIAAAGGGVWKTTNALAATPSWKPVSVGIPSNSVGSLVFDTNDATGNTLYVGTGEPNGSSDSEAGVGLYKSINGGGNWTLVAGSTAANAPCADGSGNTCSVATGRSIGAIAIDPANANHIFIGTDVARHGVSSVNGGRFTPPGGAKIGLYESTDGGTTFSPAVILAQDVVDPNSPTGGDFYRGGCSHIELYRPASETQVYASFFDYGIYRRSNTQDGDSSFHQIFASAGGGTVGASSAARTEFSLAPNGSNLRIYVGDAPAPASFWRVDDANVGAATLFTGGTNGGWTRLSNSANGTPGFASYNYCSTQCTYDMPVFSPPGSPGIVYIGSSMQYSEIGGRSNGRAIQRSEDAGVNFTDMTIDTNGVSLHPDQHAIASTPFNPNIVFIANDGGIWRLDGSFSDVHSQCGSRLPPLTGNNLIDCNSWLSKVPTTITSMNAGLATLQYQSLSVSTQNPLSQIMGGTQDNGTHAFDSPGWFVTFFGDGGNGGINVANQEIRMLTLFSQAGLSQIIATYHFNSTDAGTWNPILAGYPSNEVGWAWVGDPGSNSGENMSFYIPVRTDPSVNGTWFFGAQHVWRTQDNGGPQAYLDQHCNLFVGDFTVQCGDWVPIGQDLSSTSFGTDKTPGPAGYVVAISRAASDSGTLWAATRRGRVFVASNADNASAAAVTFYRIDTSSQPERFVSGIDVDPANPNHAFVSYSGYNAYATAAGTATGHIFEVTYNPTTHTATWSGDLASNLGDQPITGIAVDWQTKTTYVSTDFGVFARRSGKTNWQKGGNGLPPVAVYGLSMNVGSRVLYAATHGRSAWMLNLQ
jgi:hypothetical protein